MNYSLKLHIDPIDLATLKQAALNIILAKPVQEQSDPNVVWQSFDPFSDNSVDWAEVFGMYASTTSISHGAQISKVSTIDPAQDGAYYDFSQYATFVGPETGPGAPQGGTYKVNNNMPVANYRALTFGLMQSATINEQSSGLKPLNAASIPANLTAEFTPLTTVYIWLQARIQSETVITDVYSKHTKVVFGNGIFTNALHFDPNLGIFVPVA